MKSAWCTAVALAALAGPLAAGSGVWTPVGGPVAPAAKVLLDPERPATLYALASLIGTNDQTLWKTTDGGAHWFSIQAGVGAPVSLLALDPRQPENLYAWGHDEDLFARLWASEDGGATWEVRFAAGLDNPGPGLVRLVASPVASGVLYGLGFPQSEERHQQVFRSTDGGATWQRRGEVGSFLNPELFADVERDLLYFFDLQGLSAPAPDGGRTWSVRGRFAGQGFRAMAQAPSAPEVLYALPSAAGTCLARSTDRGATWRRTNSPRLTGSQASCSGVAVDPHDSRLVA